jgi:hypothetical protein
MPSPTAASWEDFVAEFRGPSYLATKLDNIEHPTAKLLRLWRDQGVPAETTSEPWSLDQKDACIRRGCHKSAKDHAAFLRKEMAEFVEIKYWVILPYKIIRHLQELMMSPAAVKDERERMPRLLCNHSWPWLGWPSVNETTVPHAPRKPCSLGAHYLASYGY